MNSSRLCTRYKSQYHIVFIPKYRKQIIYGRLKADVRKIIKRLCDLAISSLAKDNSKV